MPMNADYIREQLNDGKTLYIVAGVGGIHYRIIPFGGRAIIEGILRPSHPAPFFYQVYETIEDAVDAVTETRPFPLSGVGWNWSTAPYRYIRVTKDNGRGAWSGGEQWEWLDENNRCAWGNQYTIR